MSFLDLLQSEELDDFQGEYGYYEEAEYDDANEDYYYGEQEQEEDDDGIGIPEDIRHVLFYNIRHPAFAIPDHSSSSMTYMDRRGAPLSHHRILNEEDEEGDFEEEEMQDIRGMEMEMEEAMAETSRKRKRGKGRRRKTGVNTQVDYIMGIARSAYARKDFAEVLKQLHEAIQLDYKAASAWRLLAAVHGELGDPIKTLQANFLLAHLTPKDGDLWRSLAETSLQMGHHADAEYCYKKAVSANHGDLISLEQLSKIYARQSRFQKAIDGFSTILRHMPHRMEVISELSRIYLTLKDVPRAISLFESALEADANSPLMVLPTREGTPDEEVVGLIGGLSMADIAPKKHLRIGYDELHMLVELYFEVREFEKAYNAIRVVLVRIQGLEKMRVDAQNFDEFLGIYDDMPVEIRVKLGICRLWLDDVEKAKKNFKYLFREAVNEYTSQYYEVADAFSEKTHDECSHGSVRNYGKERSSRTWRKLAFGLQQLGNYEDAVELYEAVLEDEPDDVDSKIQLAEIYNALGDEKKAAELMTDVHMQGKKTSSSSKVFLSPEKEHPSSALLRKVSPKSVSRGESESVRQDRAIQAAEEAVKVRENQASWEKMNSLMDKLDDIFKRTDRTKQYTGTHRKRRIDEDADMSEFQGLSFDQWYTAFGEYARALAKDGKEEDSFTVLKSAYDANVFYHDDKRRRSLHLQMIASALYCGNYNRVVQHMRGFFIPLPENNELYRLYMAMITGGGQEAVLAFAASTEQKYFLRQIKSIDTAHEKDALSISLKPSLLILYGHILFCARSYGAAIFYYVRAFNISPNDSMANMSLGIAYLHVAMQRRAKNRQLRIGQALTYMLRYYEIEKGSMEACYNLARAFHQLGIMDHAIDYYQKVLAGPGDSPGGHLKMEAAYNLSMIMLGSGTPQLAQELIFTYCEV
ncbi:hypothetical protein BC829DRAFT_417432 [Chytridium lagenaria]|nr:hypothetical protein BC829DRAFT_417432 [Chytridium lagenaria]